MRLSDHFTLREFTKSDTAIRHGIDNSTDDHVIIERLVWLANEICEPIRAEFGPFSPNSGYRSKALNDLLGSSDRSRHRMGTAVDLEHGKVDNRELAHWIADNCSAANYVLLEWYKDSTDPDSGWIHVESWPDNDVPNTYARKTRCARTPDGRRFFVGFN